MLCDASGSVHVDELVVGEDGEAKLLGRIHVAVLDLVELGELEVRVRECAHAAREHGQAALFIGPLRLALDLRHCAAPRAAHAAHAVGDAARHEARALDAAGPAERVVPRVALHILHCK